MMNDLTGMEGRKLRMPSVSSLRLVGRVTGRQRGWALGINTIPFHFPASAFPVETATPLLDNLSSARLREATTICNFLIRSGTDTGWLGGERREGWPLSDSDNMDVLKYLSHIATDAKIIFNKGSTSLLCYSALVCHTSIWKNSIQSHCPTLDCIRLRYIS